MGDHITKTSSAAFYHLYNLRRIRKYLSKECTETLIHAFISSRIDYCNSLLFGFNRRIRFRNCKETRTLLFIRNPTNDWIRNSGSFNRESGIQYLESGITETVLDSFT